MATAGLLLLPHEIYGRQQAPTTEAVLFVLAPHDHFQRSNDARRLTAASQAARRQPRIQQRQSDYPVRAGHAPAAVSHAPPHRRYRTRRQFVMPTVPEGYTPAAIPRSSDVDVVVAGVPWYSNGRFGSVPASGEAIAALEETTPDEVREKECSVCQEVFEESDVLRKTPCCHAFHESCIFEWLHVSRLCPLCRFALPIEAEAAPAAVRQ